MIQNFASQIAGCDVSASWVTRFINRHRIDLITKWTTSMDCQRHQADSLLKYNLYFDLLHSKMIEYDVQPHNIVNMDEKGFLIGVLSRSKRVFSRELWEKKEVTAALQDGSREWITLLAAICADGEVLPPGIIYASQNSTLRDTWVAGIKAGKHDVFVGSTLSGWSNNEVGLAWLEQVYDRCTKKKARYGRDWRLLIVDGHGSHLTMDFINYCDEHRILLAILPPHSTHTLQPLDVVMFKPLSTAYSSALTTYLHKSQGLIPIKKGDFFPLFWEAWVASFRKQLVEKSFSATGIWPMEREVITQRFVKKAANQGDDSLNEASANRPNTWLQLERLLRAAVAGESSESAQKLSELLHHLQVDNELVHGENEGLREALVVKKKHKKHGRALDLQQREEYHGGAVLWSPRKVHEANVRLDVKDQEEHQEKLAKAN